MLSAIKNYIHLNYPQHATRSTNDLSNIAKMYYTAKEGSYSSLVMVVTLGEGTDALKIASVYGKFDEAVLGKSINVPSVASSSVNLSIMQMTAFTGDEAGKAYFSNPDVPPNCNYYNYCIMTFDVKDNSFSLKPSDWKVGDNVPYTLNISEMTPLAITDLPNTQTWCKDLPKAALKAAEDNTSSILTGLVIAVAVILLIYLVVGRNLRT